MMYVPTEARCVFVDGPVAIFVHQASEQEIMEAYRRLERMMLVAAQELNKREKVDDKA